MIHFVLNVIFVLAFCHPVLLFCVSLSFFLSLPLCRFVPVCSFLCSFCAIVIVLFFYHLVLFVLSRSLFMALFFSSRLSSRSLTDSKTQLWNGTCILAHFSEIVAKLYEGNNEKNSRDLKGEPNVTSECDSKVTNITAVYEVGLLSLSLLSAGYDLPVTEQPYTGL